MEENNIEVSGDKKTGNYKIAIIISFIVITIVAIVIIAVIVPSDLESREKLSISNTNMIVTYNEYLGYSATITGVAKNISGQDLSYASVEFSVYDVSGNNLGTALANINNLMKGDTWRFEATLLSFPSVRPSTYKLADLTAYSL